MATPRLGMVWAVGLLAGVLVATTVACSPRSRGDDDDDDEGDDGDDGDDGDAGVPDGGPVCVIPEPEVCDNGRDDDCDAIVDCDDVDCAGVGSCPGEPCGSLEQVEGSALDLPDGACPEDETEPCEGYDSTLDFTGFEAGQTLDGVEYLQGICVNMEHSWVRDLVIYATCPNGTRVMLSDFVGHQGGEVNLGIPNDDDEWDPTPGEGWDYCWTPNATNDPWITYANENPQLTTLPAGDYQSSESLDAFVGCPLNGEWTIRVEDRWGIDNGFIFRWSVRFDPAIVDSCEDWPF